MYRNKAESTAAFLTSCRAKTCWTGFHSTAATCIVDYDCKSIYIWSTLSCLSKKAHVV